jgi:hypothetical protein
VSGASITLLTAGTCSITASQTGNSSYSAAAPVTQTFIVTAPPLLSTFSVSPAMASGITQTFTAVYYDPAGVSELSSVMLLANGNLNVANACFAAYIPASGSLMLFNDEGTSFVTGSIPAGSNQTLSNSQCTLSSGGPVTTTTNSLTVRFTMTSTNAFAGSRMVFGMDASSLGGYTSWQQLGIWSVPAISLMADGAAAPPQAPR